MMQLYDEYIVENNYDHVIIQRTEVVPLSNPVTVYTPIEILATEDVTNGKTITYLYRKEKYIKEQIIKCKDCKFSCDNPQNNCLECHSKQLDNEVFYYLVKEDDYCSYGERKYK